MNERKQIYRLLIVDSEDQVLEVPVGGKLEQDFVEAITQEIVKQGVGIFRTENQVKKAILQGVASTFRAMKMRTSYMKHRVPN